jgi:NAD/NADP transhydrogenase alpha subunit
VIIGVPKEIKEQERRIALVPSAAEQLTKRGHTVLVEKNGGIGSGYPDEEYKEAGAEIVHLAKDVFARADMIVKVKGASAEFPLCARTNSFHLSSSRRQHSAHRRAPEVRRDRHCLRNDSDRQPFAVA